MEYFYFERDPQLYRSSFAVSHPGQLITNEENFLLLDQNHLDQIQIKSNIDTAKFAETIAKRQLMAINRAHPRWQEINTLTYIKQPARVNILACGDVGSTILLGLKLLAGASISSIGIFDINNDLSRRCEFELNQIAAINNDMVLPEIEIIDKTELFNCDIFVFCATAGVPDLANKNDVRLLQYERNAKIIKEYAQTARVQQFKGIFAVVSDPVDLLCQTVFIESNKDSAGNFDAKGLLAEQIEGFGLGVMHARAAYYAKKEPRFFSYLSEGRAYGPHGNGLIIANSIDNYDDALSRELTELAATANIKAREYGFKPYIAPAISSAALSLLATIKGEWHYSSTYLGGIFLGAKNRRTTAGIELEILPLPVELKKRLEDTTKILQELKSSLVLTDNNK